MRDIKKLKKTKSRAGILGKVRNPLGFFALALLIVEGMIGIVVSTSNLTSDQTFIAILIMSGIFVLVVGVVTLITVKWPTHLYETIVEIKSFLEGPALRDVIYDVIEETLQKKHKGVGTHD